MGDDADPPRPPAGELAGVVAGRYRIERKIGDGANAIVYLAHDLQRERMVALKVLRAELAAAISAERFVREIRFASGLQHPHIIPVWDAGSTAEPSPRPFYVMPFVEGESLRQRLDRVGPLPTEDAIRLAREVADALGHVHAQNILHRDIKPENILLEGGHAIVADLGLARAIGETDADRLTRSGVVVGTAAYISPEQSGSSRTIDGRSDLYSLGCVLYEMLAGDPPFTGRSVQAVVARHMLDRPPSLGVIRSTLPTSLIQCVDRLLAKMPADRFANAAELIAALDAVPHDTRSGPPPSPAPPPPPPWRRWLLAAGVLATSLLLLVLVRRPKPPPPDPNRVIVFPLIDKRHGGSDGETVSLMIGNTLGQVDPLRWLNGWSFLGAETRADPLRLTADSARAIARRQRAAHYVDGWIIQDGDSVSVVLTLNDAVGNSDPVEQRVVGRVGERSPIQLGLDATVRLMPALLGRQVDLSVLADRKPTAIADFLLGEASFYRARFVTALEHYQRALLADSALVIAAVKGTQAASWLDNVPVTRAMARAVLVREPLLPPRYTSLARGLVAYQDGEADSAVIQLKQAIAADSLWSEAWMALGEVYYHLLPEAAPLDSLAEAAFLRSQTLQPQYAPSLFHLIQIAIRRSALDSAQAMFRRYQGMAPDSAVTLPLDLMLRCAAGKMNLADWRRAAATAYADVTDAAHALAAAPRYQLCSQEGFRAVLEEPSAGGWYAPNAFYALQASLAGAGKLGDVDSALSSAQGRDMGGPWYAVINTVAGRGGERLADSVVHAQGVDYGRMGPAKLRFLAVYAAYRRNTPQLGLIDSILTTQADTSSLAEVRLAAQAVHAHRLLADGDTVAALAGFAALRAVGDRALIEWSPWESLGLERLVETRIRLARKDYVGVLRVGSVFDAPEPMAFVLYRPEALGLRMRAAAALGRRDLINRFR